MPNFPVIIENKYLDREIGMNSDEFLVDDHFYNINGTRVKALPNFNEFGIIRLLFITALCQKNI